MNMVAKNDLVTLVPYKNRDGKVRAVVKHNGVTIGMLSWKSRILRRIVEQESNDGVLPCQINGLFVNEVFVWTKEDTEKYDNEYNTNFLSNWSQNAIDKGYVFVVDFAGYAR